MSNNNLVNDLTFYILILIIVVLAIVLRKLIIKKADSSIVNIPLGIMAIYCSAFILIVAVISAKFGIFSVSTTGNPNDTVAFFYDSIIVGNYDNAYALLNNCDTLGLENEITLDENDIVNIKLISALNKSYSYSISSNAIISGLNASTTVSFTYLDVNKVIEATKENVEPILNRKIDELPRAELYTADGHYQKSLMDAVYSEALEKALRNVKDYYQTTDYDLTLEYKKGQWYLNASDSMIKGFVGGQ